MDAKFLGNINSLDFGTSYAGAVWDSNYICPTLNTMQGGGQTTDDCNKGKQNRGNPTRKQYGTTPKILCSFRRAEQVSAV